MNDSEALGFIRGARALLKDEQEQNDSRELFIVITKLDEAEMWLSRDIRFKTPKENLKEEKKLVEDLPVTSFRNLNHNKGEAMITKHDADVMKGIKQEIDERAMKKNEIDLNAEHQIDVIDRVVNNLSIAHLSYRDAPEEDIADDYFTAECRKCGWWGSSKLLDGGEAIADTGDHFDCTCPVCANPGLHQK